jgi:hypothetical protein
MGKFSTYILIICGLSLFFYIFGITKNINPLLQLIMDAHKFSFNAFSIVSLTAITLSSVAAGILIIMKNYELAASTVVYGFLFSLLSNFLEVYSIIFSYNQILSWIFLAPTLFLFGVAGYDWWRGRD